ncbi:hypothetical protein HPB52_013011 [Rhipicephalus sanguineus]|uniref:THAP-type domain-containing protein n=1 Tax=Rhipicephalus sanguineus TaxID=34632 RepID=A0A9D4TA10_RHISA|nr:hypothetical protein HPB52_013011 [Rhipicephalus sanguineus]
MPQYCAAYGCCDTFGRDEIDLHKFPRDQKMAAKWVTGVKRKDFKPTRASVLSSKHFHDSDYVRSPSLMQSLGLTIKIRRVAEFATCPAMPRGSALSTMLRSGSVTHTSVLGVFSIWYFGVLSIKCSARPSVLVSELRSHRNRDVQPLQ